MKVIVTTLSVFDAARLKEKIISAIKEKLTSVNIETWSYTTSSEKHDIVYHDCPQYIDDPSKNVLFKIELDGNNVVFSTCWWSKNPEPSHEMLSLHTGRLIEMLLAHFSQLFTKVNIVGF